MDDFDFFGPQQIRSEFRSTWRAFVNTGDSSIFTEDQGGRVIEVVQGEMILIGPFGAWRAPALIWSMFF